MAVSGTLSAPASPAARREIVLFSPEHFYVFNTLAVPQLTGYLLEHGYPVVQRVLDNELYRHLADESVLGAAVEALAAGRGGLRPEHARYLHDAAKLARIPEQLGFRADEPGRTVDALLRRREVLVRLLHRSEAQLRERFMGLARDRFLLALARVQVAVDLCFARFWPSTFGVLGGLEMRGATRRSRDVLATSADAATNPFLAYYRETVVPSIPAGAVLAGISVTHETQVGPAFTLARVIREQRPDLHITLGGATVSTLRETLTRDNPLSPLYDSVVAGPGEEAVAGLHDALVAGLPDLGAVPNLVWRAADGALRRNPARAFTPAQAATPVFTDPRPGPILTLATSTGCDWARCGFCHFPRILADEGSYSVRPAESFIRDVQTLTERHRPSYFHVCDTNVSVGQLTALTDALLQSGTQARFYSFVRADKAFTDLDFCRRVRSAGFFALHFGLESGSQEVLDRARKGIDLRDVQKVIANLHDAGIIVNVFLMAGMPGETEADVDRTVAFMREHLPRIRGEVALCRFYMDVYSDVYFRPQAYGLERIDEPLEDLATYVGFRNPTGYDDGEAESLVEDVYARIGLPRSYGERFFAEMLTDFCPNGVGQRLALYAPFVWGGVRRAAGRLGRYG